MAAVVERAGRTTSVVSLRLEREGRAQALGLATLSELPATGLAWDVAAMPAARPPEDVPPMPRDAPGAPAFMANYDMRWALPGGAAGRAGDRRLAPARRRRARSTPRSSRP